MEKIKIVPDREYQPCCDAPVIDGICQECGQDLKAFWDNFSLCHGKQMIDGVCPVCLRTKADYYHEQRVKEYNFYMGEFKLKSIEPIEEEVKTIK